MLRRVRRGPVTFTPAILTDDERREVVYALVATDYPGWAHIDGPVDLTRHRARRLDILEALRKLGVDPDAEGVKPLPTNYRS